RLRRHRAWGLLPIALAAAYLAAAGGPRWEGDLAQLSPVPESSRALDAALRAELGAPDTGQLLLARGPDPERVPQPHEKLPRFSPAISPAPPPAPASTRCSFSATRAGAAPSSSGACATRPGSPPNSGGSPPPTWTCAPNSAASWPATPPAPGSSSASACCW